MAKKIEHLVVLMMENRSFDHALGFLKSPAWPIDGLDGAETNPDSTGAPVRVTPDARYAGDLTPDPGHDFISVNEQVFGNSQGAGTGPFMQGFVRSYQTKTGGVSSSHRIMKCFGRGRLPALSTLAQEYAVCDRWFSSVPGPTLPNRAFAFGATSLGRVDMNPNYLALKTIFELLDVRGVSSRIYYTDWTIALAIRYVIERARKFLFFFDDFKKDCKKNRLPAFSFIEPRFNDLNESGQFFPASDQHPDHNVFQGEKVIKAVYDAVTSNRQTWESTLLVITYDEHGGLYDHVTPPATVNPDGLNSAVPPFDFTRLGVRVPAVLVSPFIPRGTIIHEKNGKPFDHTSIIATARKLFTADFATNALTKRDQAANTFEDVLTLSSPRQGKVNIPQPASADEPGDTSDVELEAAPSDSAVVLSEFQQAMLTQALFSDSQLPAPRRAPAHAGVISTEHDAARFLASIRARVEQGRRNGTGGKGGKKKKTTTKKATKKKAAKKKAAKKAGAKKR